MIAIFDIGSTLIEGPSYGPTRRLAELLNLGPKDFADVEELLFRTQVETPVELAERIAARLEIDLFSAIQACSTLWNAQLEEAYLLPGAREAVAALDTAGIARAYLSNIWPPFYETFRREFAAEAACPQFLSFREGRMKPDPAFLANALASLQTAPEEAVMIGDTYRNDILPAIELGLRTIWILHRPEKEQASLVEVLNGDAPVPDLTLASIAALQPELIRGLFSPRRIRPTKPTSQPTA